MTTKALEIPNHVAALASMEKCVLDLDTAIEEIDNAIAARAADLLAQRERFVKRRAGYQEKRLAAEQEIVRMMEMHGRASYKSDVVQLALRKGVQSVKIDNETLVPDDFKERTWIEQVDKKRLKAHLVAHPDEAEALGAHLERGPSKLTVKWLEQPEAPAGTDEEDDFNEF